MTSAKRHFCYTLSDIRALRGGGRVTLARRVGEGRLSKSGQAITLISIAWLLISPPSKELNYSSPLSHQSAARTRGNKQVPLACFRKVDQTFFNPAVNRARALSHERGGLMGRNEPPFRSALRAHTPDRISGLADNQELLGLNCDLCSELLLHPGTRLWSALTIAVRVHGSKPVLILG